MHNSLSLLQLMSVRLVDQKLNFKLSISSLFMCLFEFKYPIKHTPGSSFTRAMSMEMHVIIKPSFKNPSEGLSLDIDVQRCILYLDGLSY